jgi:cell division initiation protein
MRGYEKESVDSFLDQVAVALEAVKQENLRLSVELDSAKNQLAGLRQFEDTIKGAAIDARRNADMTIANAKEEAALAINKAKAEAEQILANRAEQLEEIENQISQLDLTKKSYMAKLRSLITSHLDIIEEISDAAEAQKKHDSDSIEVTESEEVESKHRETVATIPSGKEGAKVEEANAAEAVVAVAAVTSETEEQPVDGAEAGPDTGPDTEQPPEAETQVDPELAAAIEGFRANSQMDSESSAPEPPAESSTDPATGWVETDKRAEEVPDEFITGPPPNAAAPTDTDRVNVSSVEDPQPTDGQKKSGIDPGNLADELDKVVDKFEEEMDKAAKS